MIESVIADNSDHWADDPQVVIQHERDMMDVGIGLRLPHDWQAGVLADQSDDDIVETWVRLDRPAVNRLIRLLRKARDSAFGRDE